ncbi:bacillithiol biosynthesis cysteine-adding enzyme BshC [Bacillus suaedaesalsae]|uniref:Putative cysteine ligase BshC n=1 Tax=Bacillus suaedaesalsae TaxID=2810349 RepID=A0ABS2DJJ0_9BACI|nr:bacillithiol biosynthesis cysteine-adding enzyme BshC [Bacillus suaedaesalsae]MBM6618556.1 bacillithiol biosynthesis cysteine-adding enzyme BshC [Bacillus suaedaesalsae]
MEIREHNVPAANQFISDYLNKSMQLTKYFHYSPFEQSAFVERAKELEHYSFPRKEVMEYLFRYNSALGADESTLQNIKMLEDPNAMVVVGGQQAGILTGPVYTINKLITILHQARQLQEKVNRPVLPIFWIAGEDHDFEEVNHIFTEKNETIKKVPLPQKWRTKKSLSDGEIDKDACLQWVDEVFFYFGETNLSKDIIQKVKTCVHESNTYVDFFARLVFLLFKDTGLILMDSASKELRQIEIPYFDSIVKNNAQIDQALHKQQHKKSAEGYSNLIETESNTAHLFYHVNGDRVLLEYKLEDGIPYFEGKARECRFSEVELIEKIETEPHLFSNNVVTRPLMQEFLLPTLSFVAGPGEISYWAELKEVFEAVDRKMPPVFPRLMSTIITRPVQREIEELNLQTDDVLQKGVNHNKQQFLREIMDHEANDEITLMKEVLRGSYEKLEVKATSIHDSLKQIVRKNEELIHRQLDFLEQEFHKQSERKHEITLKKYNRIQNLVKPNDYPQERMLNIFYFLNIYGFDLIPLMLERTSSSEFTHKVIYI